MVGMYGWQDAIVIEKPFGHDRASAHALNEVVHTVFAQENVYRIDRFLGNADAGRPVIRCSAK